MQGRHIKSHTLLCCIIHHLVWVISISGKNLSIGAIDVKSSQHKLSYDHTFLMAKGIASRSTETSTHPNKLASSYSTLHPSESPTSTPTLACHDSGAYQNPLNPLLRCEHHRNTPCKRWKYLGLSDADIETLLSSCPISCNVPCR